MTIEGLLTFSIEATETGTVHTGFNWTGFGIITILLLIAAVLGFANYLGSRSFEFTFTTSLPPDAALDRLQQVLAQDGFTLSMRNTSILIMQTERGASGLSVVLLAVIWWVLALVRAMSGKHLFVTQIEADSNGSRTDLAIYGSRASDGYERYMKEMLREVLPA